ncbi:MAG: glycosyltransferase, partial [Nitrospinota bacterium]
RALNRGMRASGGEFLVCLSGHCIPVHNKWLDRLVADFGPPEVAAVYGRQEPLPDSHTFDKRDLWNIFGLDRKVQVKDSFFHNANAMIRRDVWERIPFDEELNGVEDRDWAKRVIASGYHIVYEPQASVYHPHGIHQTMDAARAERVVKMIELINGRQPLLDE